MVIDDFVMVFDALIALDIHSNGGPSVRFSCQIAMVQLVLAPFKEHPKVLLVFLRFVEILDYAICHATMVGEGIFVDVELNNRSRRGVAIGKIKPVDHQILAPKFQI